MAATLSEYTPQIAAAAPGAMVRPIVFLKSQNSFFKDSTMATDNKQIVQAVNDAFSTGNLEGFFQLCTDDVRWTMAGKRPTTGKEALRQMMANDDWNPPVINVRSTIAEGDMAVCEGNISMSNKKGEQFEGVFCDIYRIEQGRIKELLSYIVPEGNSSVPQS